MIKTNKLVTLGVLAAIGANFVLAPAASAATGATTFTYTAGQVTGGGDGDGSGDSSNDTWAVSIPVKVNLTDANDSSANAKKFQFSVKPLDDTKTLTQALNGKTIKITPSTSTTTGGSYSGGILTLNGSTNQEVQLLQAASVTPGEKVTDSIATFSASDITSQDAVGKEYSKTAGAYFVDHQEVAEGTTYSAKVIWDITDNK